MTARCAWVWLQELSHRERRIVLAVTQAGCTRGTGVPTAGQRLHDRKGGDESDRQQTFVGEFKTGLHGAKERSYQEMAGGQTESADLSRPRLRKRAMEMRGVRFTLGRLLVGSVSGGECRRTGL